MLELIMKRIRLDYQLIILMKTFIYINLLHFNYVKDERFTSFAYKMLQ